MSERTAEFVFEQQFCIIKRVRRRFQEKITKLRVVSESKEVIRKAVQHLDNQEDLTVQDIRGIRRRQERRAGDRRVLKDPQKIRRLIHKRRGVIHLRVHRQGQIQNNIIRRTQLLLLQSQRHS